MKFKQKYFIPLLLLIIFIILINYFFSVYNFKKRYNITKNSAAGLRQKIIEYKKYFNKYPDTLNNLITDTFIVDNKMKHFIGAVTPELLTKKFSNKVQVNGKLKADGSGWWYNNKTGELKINNKKFSERF